MRTMPRQESAADARMAPVAAKDSPATLDIEIHSHRVLRRVFLACAGLELTFVLLDYFINYRRGVDIVYIRRMFNITREDSIASWFTITQTMLAALTAWGIWLLARARRRSVAMAAVDKGRHGTGSGAGAAGWLVIAIFLTYMALDDGATIHERLGSTLKDAQRDGSLHGFPSYFWQIIFVPLFGFMGLFMMWFFWRQAHLRRQAVVVAIALGCMAFAVGMDFIEGLEPEHDWNIYTALANRLDFGDFARRNSSNEYQTLLHFSKSLEETIEALSMTLLWVVLLGELMRQASGIRVRCNINMTPARSVG
jgi:hypothetical protein